MFKVKYKYDRNPKPEIIYSVHRGDDGTTEFLMFQFGEWCWRDADSYKPWEEKENNSEYEQGEFEVLNILSSAYHGEQYYFMQDVGIIYSRDSGKYLYLDDAISEFARKIGDDGSS